MGNRVGRGLVAALVVLGAVHGVEPPAPGASQPPSSDVLPGAQPVHAGPAVETANLFACSVQGGHPYGGAVVGEWLHGGVTHGHESYAVDGTLVRLVAGSHSSRVDAGIGTGGWAVFLPAGADLGLSYLANYRDIGGLHDHRQYAGATLGLKLAFLAGQVGVYHRLGGASTSADPDPAVLVGWSIGLGWAWL